MPYEHWAIILNVGVVSPDFYFGLRCLIRVNVPALFFLPVPFFKEPTPCPLTPPSFPVLAFFCIFTNSVVDPDSLTTDPGSRHSAEFDSDPCFMTKNITVKIENSTLLHYIKNSIFLSQISMKELKPLKENPAL
jgi:hypothetical protein